MMRTQASEGAPAGIFPDRTSAVAGPASSGSSDIRSCSQAVPDTFGLGSLNSVTTPSSVCIVTLRRLGPMISVKRCGTPRSVRSASTVWPGGPPAKPVASVGYPIAMRTEETLTPLPPARARTLRTRCAAPGTSRSSS
jgi:hypothetical protein